MHRCVHISGLVCLSYNFLELCLSILKRISADCSKDTNTSNNVKHYIFVCGDLHDIPVSNWDTSRRKRHTFIIVLFHSKCIEFKVIFTSNSI